jgi:hypothetical protein
VLLLDALEAAAPERLLAQGAQLGQVITHAEHLYRSGELRKT